MAGSKIDTQTFRKHKNEAIEAFHDFIIESINFLVVLLYFGVKLYVCMCWRGFFVCFLNFIFSFQINVCVCK